MYRAITRRIPRDSDLPFRTWQLEGYRRVLDGTLYDVLPHDFHEERLTNGEYVPLRDRAPSVRYGLCRTVVEDSVSLLFSEGHFPTIQTEHEPTREALANVIKESRLNSIMVDAAIRGSIGSVAILMQVLKGRLFFKVLDTGNLTPEYDPEEPDRLVKVVERYKVRGRDLAKSGYRIPASDMNLWHWFGRSWGIDDEEWLLPWLVGEGDDKPEKQVVDSQRTVAHGLGFVPVVWVRNLPGGDDIDGACTFAGAIHTQIEIEYQLSQAGRGLKYSSDPLLLIKEPAGGGGGDLVRSGSDALVVSKDGDAKLLEIGGSAASAVLEYVRALREYALEAVHGNRASPEKMSAAQSGRALELMNQGLIWLTDNLRVSYGENGLLTLANMIVAASNKYALTCMGKPLGKLNATQPLSLRWSRWYPSTAHDRMQDAETLSKLAASEHMSQETAVKSVAENYDIDDVPAEIARIKADRAERIKEIPPANTTFQIRENV